MVYNLIPPWRYTFFVAVAKFLAGIIVLSASFHEAVCQPRETLAEYEKQYSQSVKNKEYGKAALYSLEIAKIHTETKAPAKALEYLAQSQAHSKRANDNITLYAALYRMGELHAEAKNFKKTLDDYLGALAVATKIKDYARTKESLVKTAVAYGDLERYKKSIEYLDEALSLAIEHDDLNLQLTCYDLLSKYYLTLGDRKKSNEYLAHYKIIIQSVQNEELKARELRELKQHLSRADLDKLKTQSQLSEQTEKLERTTESLRAAEDSLQQTEDSLKVLEGISANRQLEIDLLHKDKELTDLKIKEQDARIKNEQLLRNSIAMGAVLAAALVMVLIISYRKKLKTNEKIKQQNKNIRSSINYAKRIQEAMLPKRDHHPKLAENSFVLFKPRDVVSGDFYWFSDVGENHHTGTETDLAFAAVDCTGHGVPGAFMSMIGINSLNGIINRGITETNVILDFLDKDIRTALRQEVTGNNDGMDVALCIYRKEKKTLEFSGAKNPLVYIQDHTLFQVKGDVHSIGGSARKQNFSFKRHEVVIDKPTMIYLFSDGYRDQFGGKENAKFMSKRFSNLLLEIHALPLNEQLKVLDDTLEEWKGSSDQTDDILVMGIRLGGLPSSGEPGISHAL